MSTLRASRHSLQEVNDTSIDAPGIDIQSLSLDALFNNVHYDLDTANTIIDSISTVKDRCQITPFYIQAIIAKSSVFLVSNTGSSETLNLTPSGACWLLGQSITCALPIENATVDHCHAVIRYEPDSGFFLADIGSRSGTCLNRRPLIPQKRQHMRDGDLMELGGLRLEFFVDNFDLPEGQRENLDLHDVTYTGMETYTGVESFEVPSIGGP